MIMPPTAKGIYMVELIGVLITRISILAMHVLQSQLIDPQRIKAYNQTKVCMCMKYGG